jgi:flagellar hook-associated protein 1 FlgK
MLIELDTLFHNIISMINEATAPTQPPTVQVDDGMGGSITVPNTPYILSDPTDPTSAVLNPHYTGPYALDKETQGIEVFSRKDMPRFGVMFVGVDSDPSSPTFGDDLYEYGFIPPGYMRDPAVSDPPIYIPDPNSPPPSMSSMYTMGNIIVNPVFNTADGYTKLCFSRSGDVEDATIIHELLHEWTRNFMGVEGRSVDTLYSSIITSMASEIRESDTVLTSQMQIVNSIDNERRATSGVSLDEEMTAMMKFQHAYNSASRMLSVIDSMIETIVMRLGAGRG